MDADKVDANFEKGVLTVTLPKTPEAQKTERKITVKAAQYRRAWLRADSQGGPELIC